MAGGVVHGGGRTYTRWSMLIMRGMAGTRRVVWFGWGEGEVGR